MTATILLLSPIGGDGEDRRGSVTAAAAAATEFVIGGIMVGEAKTCYALAAIAARYVGRNW